MRACSLFLYFSLVAEVLTIVIMPSTGLRGIYITGWNILIEACVRHTPVIQKVLMQKKKKSGVGMGNPIPLKDKEEVPLTSLVSPFLVLT